ncbi:MAG: YolD-like family protein [Sporolactobacillus sp.]
MNKLTPGTNLRWTSSRLILPEHIAAWRAQHEAAETTERPTLDEQMLESLDQCLRQAVATHTFIALSYYRGETIRQKNCTIDAIDPIIGEITISDAHGFHWAIPFCDIVSIG